MSLRRWMLWERASTRREEMLSPRETRQEGDSVGLGREKKDIVR